MKEIQNDMVTQVTMFESEIRHLEAKRLKERTEFDLEMMRELGYCSGIENYSRYFDRRASCTEAEIELDQKTHFQIDGEYMGMVGHLKIEILPGTVKLLG